MASAIISLTLVVSLGAVGAHGLPPGGGERRGPLLQHLIEGNPPVQARPLLLHLQASYLAHFTDVRFMQHWHTVRRLGPVPGGMSWGGLENGVLPWYKKQLYVIF